jgi:hypothetical protein
VADGISVDNEMLIDNFVNIEICQHTFSNMLIKVECVRTSIRVSICTSIRVSICVLLRFNVI